MTTVGACTMIRDERPSLLEWIAYHMLIGVSEFVIFDNDSVDGTTQLLQRLGAHYPIERVPWPGRGVSRQTDAFTEGARRLAGKVDFAAFIDIDEFVVVDENGSLVEALSTVPDDVSAIAMCQLLFGSNARENFEPDLVTSRFTRRAVDDTPSHQWIKTIVRPEQIEHFTTSHSAALMSGRYVMTDGGPMTPANEHPGEAERICHSGIRLNHYMLKSREEYQLKKIRGANYDPLRFDDGYFIGRDSIANAVEDNSLVGMGREIRLKSIELAASADITLARRAFAGICL